LNLSLSGFGLAAGLTSATAQAKFVVALIAITSMIAAMSDLPILGRKPDPAAAPLESCAGGGVSL
jgi:hypothetical protein